MNIFHHLQCFLFIFWETFLELVLVTVNNIFPPQTLPGTTVIGTIKDFGAQHLNKHAAKVTNQTLTFSGLKGEVCLKPFRISLSLSG